MVFPWSAEETIEPHVALQIKGYYSVNQAAKILNVPAQKLYYATRAGYLKASRKGAAWVIHEDDIKGYSNSYLAKKLPKSKVHVG